jgi:phosphatidylglycerol lysyltransferase
VSGLKRFRIHFSSEVLGVHAVALLTAAMGVVNVLAALRPSMEQRLRLLEQYSPLQVTHGGHLTSALAGFALLIFSSGLWRRKRVAWLLTLLVLLGSIVTHLLKGLDYEEASLAAMLCIVLLIWRPHFHARSDPPSIRQAIYTMAAALAFTLVYGVAGFFLLDRHFRVHFGLWDAARQTVVMFTQYYDPGLQPITGFGRYFADSIYVVAVATTGYSLLLLIRPVLARRRASPDERASAAEVVRAYGRTPLARLTLLDDKLYYFTSGGSLIAYVVEGRVAVALGDPIGPVDDAYDSIEEFKQFCSLNDWIPAFYQVLPDYLEKYARAGLRSVQIGQEGVVDLKSFTLEGGERKSIRGSVNKMKRLGYCAEVLQPPHPRPLLQQLREVSDQWLSDRHTSEMRFSVGWFDEAYLNSCPVLVVRNSEGAIEAFLNIIAGLPAGEVTVDMMRHRSRAEKGQMDFLFASLLEWARQSGFGRFNFGLSALSGIGERPADPAIEKALRYVFEHINRFYNFKGLHDYKDKYGPIWSPRYLIYPNVAGLPAVGAALVQANTGSDLLGGYLLHPQ